MVKTTTMTVMDRDELAGRLVEVLVVLVLGKGEGAVVEAVDEETLAEEDLTGKFSRH
jgi:hypothetical protein